MQLHRRHFLNLAAALPLAAQGRVTRNPGARTRLALNAYSFNEPLRSGAMTLPDVLDYCAQHNIDAFDATGYYFPNYPAVPSDDYIYSLKRKAFVNGITICGTGVRNDFAVADPAKRQADLTLVKNWILVARKLGANTIRVFSGLKIPEGQSFDDVLKWMVPLFQECAEYARRHGVVVALQNHNDFLKTADETIRVLTAVNSDCFGLMLDIGSLRQSDPYAEIEKLLPYAVSWQLKENLWVNGKEVPTDLRRIKAIIEKGGYRGLLPIETLGAGDPKIKVARFFSEARSIFGS